MFCHWLTHKYTVSIVHLMEHANKKMMVSFLHFVSLQSLHVKLTNFYVLSSNIVCDMEALEVVIFVVVLSIITQSQIGKCTPESWNRG
jgi:hypothetical protein